MNLLQGLNAPQRAAVEHTQGPLLIFAGAGSGKTRTLTHRIAHLVQDCGVPPSRILAVTFTNKAAKEMKERLEKLLGNSAASMWLGTFHALCARMLRIHGEQIGLPSRFAIFDTDDQTRLVKALLKESNLDSERLPAGKVLGRISDAKNHLRTPEQVMEGATKPHEKIFANLYAQYQQRLRLAAGLDFDDLLFEAVRLLQQSQSSRDYWSERFLYVLIDEFQDVNEAQFEWARLLASRHNNICVVGDDDQSIYAWRGANVEIILDFERRFPQATIIKLEQNYRSTQNILDAAHSVIANNAGRADKQLWTDQAGGEKLVLHGAQSAQEEASWIVQEIQRICRMDKRSYQDFAVLCRVNAQTRPLEEAFMRNRVPLRLVGTQRFYDRREIRDLMAYLKFLYNPDDGVSLGRLINTPPRGIGAATIARLESLAVAPGRSTGRLLLDERTESLLTPAVARKLAPLRRLLEQLQEDMRQAGTLARLVECVVERTQFLDSLRTQREADGVDRAANVHEFLVAAAGFDERIQQEEPDEESQAQWGEDDTLQLGRFLAETALEGGGDKEAAGAEAVTLMTLHSAKGLEFPIVFLTGLEQNLLPHARALYGESANFKELEEERRLLYVGLTRARELAVLTYATQRTLNGRTEMTQPSQFLDEIPAELLQRKGLATGSQRLVQRRSSWGQDLGDLPRPESKKEPWVSPFGNAKKQDGLPPTFKVGDKVRHATYGVGVVVAAATVGGPAEWVEVAFFSGIGTKKLIVAFANLSREEPA
jgi:DNA helicase-2/ATP-dependent DNA helicase PcrA